MATPLLIAEMVPEFAPVASAATAMVATSVIVTSVVVPIITSIWAKKFNPNLIKNDEELIPSTKSE